jgi:hypothetical protein
MRKWFTGMFLVAVIVAAITGCGKGGQTGDNGNGGGDGPHVIDLTDTIFPEIVIYTPVLDQVYTTGAAINVTGKVTDAGGLYQGSIRITNDANGTVLKEQLYEIHGTVDYSFNISYTTAVSTASDYTVSVSYEDHGLNTTSKSVKVKVNP